MQLVIKLLLLLILNKSILQNRYRISNSSNLYSILIYTLYTLDSLFYSLIFVLLLVKQVVIQYTILSNSFCLQKLYSSFLYNILLNTLLILKVSRLVILFYYYNIYTFSIRKYIIYLFNNVFYFLQQVIKKSLYSFIIYQIFQARTILNSLLKVFIKVIDQYNFTIQQFLFKLVFYSTIIITFLNKYKQYQSSILLLKATIRSSRSQFSISLNI